MEKYYILTESEDGGISMSEGLTKEEVLERVSESYYGEGMKWLDTFPGLSDNMFDIDQRDSYLYGVIIKGNVILPRPKTVVQTYQLD